MPLFHQRTHHLPAENLIESTPDPVFGIGKPHEVTNLDAPTWERRGMQRQSEVSVPKPSRQWTREPPTQPGMWWARLIAFPDTATLVRLIDSQNGLVVVDSGGRLARTVPCEWAVPRLSSV